MKTNQPVNFEAWGQFGSALVVGPTAVQSTVRPCSNSRNTPELRPEDGAFPTPLCCTVVPRTCATLQDNHTATDSTSFFLCQEIPDAYPVKQPSQRPGWEHFHARCIG